MTHTFARFSASPIGPLLLVGNDGLTLTTGSDGADLARSACSTVAHATGTHGAEFVFWGDADLLAAIGIVLSTASLSSMVGGNAQGIGWRLDTGQVFVGGVAIADGLPSVAKGNTVGVRVRLDSTPVVEFYLGETMVHSHTLTAGGLWHFAASLGAPEAATLWAYVNAGQQTGGGPAAAAGWRLPDSAISPVRLSDLDWLDDQHHRYEGVIDATGLTTVAAIDFWPWGGSSATAAGAQLTVNDAGHLDALAQADVRGVPVSLRQLDTADSGAGIDVARYAVDSIETLDDGRKVLHLRDAHADLDDPINPGVFLPNVPALAWRTMPLVLGAVASVPVLGANTDGSVGWVADAPLASIAAVLDRGDPMEPGTWSLASDMQQILLEQPPVGPVVADVSTIGPDQQPASLQQALHAIFSRIGKATWSSDDAAAIDTVTGYAGIGYYAGDVVTAGQASAGILPSYGASLWQDNAGQLRIGRVVDPATVPPTFALDGLDFDDDLVLIPDEAPRLSRRMAYQPNARVLAAGELVTDLVDVPVWRRAELTAPWRGQVYSGKPLSPRYAHADTNAPLVSVFWRATDAQAEIDRVCNLYAQARAFYVATFVDATFSASPGDVGVLTYPRYGLQAGKRVLIRSIERNPMTGKVSLTLWG